MSRLESHQQREFKKKLTIYVVLLIGLVILLATAGLHFLINSSILIGSLGNKRQTTTQQDSSFFGSLDISDVPTATNSAQIIISGSATDYSKLDFYINDKKVKSKTLKNSGDFSEQIGDLKVGDNRIYLQAATDDNKHQKTSDIYTVTYKNVKPKIDVKEPQDGAKTDNPEITVTGETDADVTIHVNNLPVVVNAQNQFQTSVRLKEGDNTIVVTAEDNAGNSEKKELKVTYQKD